MNFMSGRQQLVEEMQKLNIQFRRLEEQWDDEQARAFKKNFMEQLKREMKLCSGALQELEDVFEQIRKECI